MNVSVKLFAAARELAGEGVVEVELREGATVSELRVALAEKHPALSRLVRHSLFAIDSEFAAELSTIPAEAEIACIPPVSGG